MKFTVRNGFVIHDIRMVEQGGKKVEQTNSYYEGDDVDFDEATAAKHLHKLEPIDKAATTYCANRFAPVAEPVTNGLDAAAVAAIVQAAVTAALAAQASAAAPAVPGNAKAPA